jgi:hypothetical protein
MNTIPIYREQFQNGIKEITNMGGKVQKIYNNVIYFRQNNADYVYVPEMTDSGPVFFKKTNQA